MRKSTYVIRCTSHKSVTLLKVILLRACFSRFINCTNVTKLCNAKQIIYTPMLKIWKICTCATHEYLLIHFVYKFSDTLSIENLVWELPLINGVYMNVVSRLSQKIFFVLLNFYLKRNKAIQLKFGINMKWRSHSNKLLGKVAWKS